MVRQRELTHAFLRLQRHSLFDHHFCRVGRANEKGHVEDLLGFVRRNFLVPIPRGDALETAKRRQRSAAGRPAGSRSIQYYR